jgi:two-component system response regulator NreC
MGEPISIVLVDDHEVVRSALRLLLDDEDDLEVVAEAGEIDAASRLLRDHRPDVLILDRNLRAGPSTPAIPSLRAASPETAIVVLTAEREPSFARDALRVGVLGYVLKDEAKAQLVAAVRMAAAGSAYLPPELSVRLAALPEADDDGLSPRELEVVRLVAHGLTNAEIGARLGLSMRTVEAHRSRVQRKLRLAKRSELVRYAIARGLLDGGTPP